MTEKVVFTISTEDIEIKAVNNSEESRNAAVEKAIELIKNGEVQVVIWDTQPLE